MILIVLVLSSAYSGNHSAANLGRVLRPKMQLFYKSPETGPERRWTKSRNVVGRPLAVALDESLEGHGMA